MNIIRRKTDKIGLALPLPNVNPNVISGLSVLTSMLFVIVFPKFPIISAVFLTFTILLDWFDGLIAKKFQRTSEEGYVVDVMSDRLSEGIIFSAMIFPWFFLFFLNCLLSMRSVVKEKHIILPLRHLFLIYLVILMVFGQ